MKLYGVIQRNFMQNVQTLSATKSATKSETKSATNSAQKRSVFPKFVEFLY